MEQSAYSTRNNGFTAKAAARTAELIQKSIIYGKRGTFRASLSAKQFNASENDFKLLSVY